MTAPAPRAVTPLMQAEQAPDAHAALSGVGSGVGLGAVGFFGAAFFAGVFFVVGRSRRPSVIFGFLPAAMALQAGHQASGWEPVVQALLRFGAEAVELWLMQIDSQEPSACRLVWVVLPVVRATAWRIGLLVGFFAGMVASPLG